MNANELIAGMSPTTLAGFIVDIEALDKGASDEQLAWTAAAREALIANVGEDAASEMILNAASKRPEPPEPLECGLCDATAADVDAAIDAGWMPTYYDGPEPNGKDICTAICEQCRLTKCHFNEDTGDYQLNAEYRDVPLAEAMTALSKELSDLEHDSVDVGVNVWHHRHSDGSTKQEQMEYKIWSSRRLENSQGETLIEAAAKFRQAAAKFRKRG